MNTTLESRAPLTDEWSGILRELRFSGALCCSGRFAEPWGISGPKGQAPLFHFVHKGQCALTHQGDTWLLKAGDLAILPHGDSHTFYDGNTTQLTPLASLLPKQKKTSVHHIRLGEGPDTTRSICGIFFIEKLLTPPFWSALPPVIHIQQQELARNAWLPGMLDGLFQELEHAGPGGLLLATKMSEVVFLLALRCFLERSFSTASGWLYALQEPRLRRALHAIHTRYAQPWTLEELASQAGMSRSLFAATFKEHTGESPMSYLTSTRMRQAANMMKDGSWELKEIASHVGFRSQVGFHNAFKRTYNTTPGAFRTQLSSP